MKKVIIEFDENVFDLMLLSITSMGQMGNKIYTSQAILDTEKHNHLIIENDGTTFVGRVEE